MTVEEILKTYPLPWRYENGIIKDANNRSVRLHPEGICLLVNELNENSLRETRRQHIQDGVDAI